MKRLFVISLLFFGLCFNAQADIWKWVDDQGNVHYSDTPTRENAKNAERVGSTSSKQPVSRSREKVDVTNRSDDIDAEEATEEGREGKDAQAYYCKRAKDIYGSYVSAPRLYRSSDDGQREYLSDAEMAAAIANAKASVEEWCN